MQVCTSSQTDNHASNPPLSFLQAGCPSCHPYNSVKALKAILAVQCLWRAAFAFKVWEFLAGCLQCECVSIPAHSDNLCGNNLRPTVETTPTRTGKLTPCYCRLPAEKLFCLQCLDAVCWAAGRASGVQKTEWWDAGVVMCLGKVQICI